MSSDEALWISGEEQVGKTSGRSRWEIKKSKLPLAIRDHIKYTGHSASLDNFCIIDRTNNEHELLIHESLLILRDRPTLNFQSSSIPRCLF